MNARKHKQHIYQRWSSIRTVFRRSKEEQAWLDIAPVGREFGSPDYERLMEEDALKQKKNSATAS